MAQSRVLSEIEDAYDIKIADWLEVDGFEVVENYSESIPD